ncbi:unnamed protein product [Brassica oleracea]
MQQNRHKTLAAKRRDHSEYESLSPVEIGVPDEQLFVIRPNQEQLAYDLLIRFQHAQTARSETSNTRTRRRSSFIQKEESPRTAAHHQPSTIRTCKREGTRST